MLEQLQKHERFYKMLKVTPFIVGVPLVGYGIGIFSPLLVGVVALFHTAFLITGYYMDEQGDEELLDDEW